MSAPRESGPPADEEPTWWAAGTPGPHVLAFALFVGGFAGGSWFIRTRDASSTLESVHAYGLWEVLLAVLVGFAAASAMYFVGWLDAIRRFGGVPAASMLMWVLVALAIVVPVFGFLFLAPGSDDIDSTLADQTRPITVVAGLCELPGLAAFIGLRRIAEGRLGWPADSAARLAYVRRLRADLHRLLTVLGGFLTLLVIVTGMRRTALLAYQDSLDVPSETVLIYGLIFAVVLAVFYLLAANAIDRVADDLLDEYAPLPAPDADDLSEKLKRRTDLASLTGGTGSWQSFQASVVIAAPLLTALVGATTG